MPKGVDYIGKQLGSWVLDRELGQGGMGWVFLAHAAAPSATSPLLAAVKVLKADVASEPDFLPRFSAEIEILQQLDHPGIVRFLESGTGEGCYYLAMEYVPGPNLQTLLRERGRLSWKEVLALALQIAPALKHAHDRGIIHRDLKPSNLLCVSDEVSGPAGLGQVKLTDFGVASLFASTHLTTPGFVVGTPAFLSPEQASGKPVTRRSDLYSLGAVLYTLVTGRPVFEGDGVDLLHKHLYAQFDRPSRFVTDLPHELDTLICQMLDKDPARRPADGAVLHRRLDSLHRKIERQTTQTFEETHQGTAVPGEKGLSPASTHEGPPTLMSRLMRRELERLNQGGPVQRLFNKPWVVLPLFLLTLGVIVWTFWPASAETLYQRGAALMASADPEDWERGWDEYLSKLEERYPGHAHAEQLAEFKRQVAAHKAGKDAARKARLAGPMGEAEWFYTKGLRLRQEGAEEAARRTWKGLVETFREVPAEAAWVKLAQQRLAESDNGKKPVLERKWQGLREALKKASELEAQGKNAEADAIRKAAAELYRDDPEGKLILEEK